MTYSIFRSIERTSEAARGDALRRGDATRFGDAPRRGEAALGPPCLLRVGNASANKLATSLLSPLLAASSSSVMSGSPLLFEGMWSARFAFGPTPALFTPSSDGEEPLASMGLPLAACGGILRLAWGLPNPLAEGASWLLLAVAVLARLPGVSSGVERLDSAPVGFMCINGGCNCDWDS